MLFVLCIYSLNEKSTNVIMRTAILTGNAIKSATKMATTPKRAKENRENEEENVDNQSNSWKTKIVKLINFVDSDEFQKLRLQKDADLFRTFLEFVLVHFVPCITWRYKCYNIQVSKIFTVSDEAMAMLLLENSVQDLKWVLRRQEKIPSNLSMPKYTKTMLGSTDRFRGWHKSGIKRYNVLYRTILTNRVKRESIEREELILDEFVKITGRDRGSNNIDILDLNDDDSISDFEPIDGFLGDEPVVIESPSENVITVGTETDSNNNDTTIDNESGDD